MSIHLEIKGSLHRLLAAGDKVARWQGGKVAAVAAYQKAVALQAEVAARRPRDERRKVELEAVRKRLNEVTTPK